MSIFDLIASPEMQRQPNQLHPVEQDRCWKIDLGVEYLKHAYNESIGSYEEAKPTPVEPAKAEPSEQPAIQDYSLDITKATPEQIAKIHERAEAEAIGYVKDQNNIHVSRN